MHVTTAKKTAPLLPATECLLPAFAERLRLARLRRKLTARQVVERAGMTSATLRNLERGNAGVTRGAYLAVMQVLGIERRSRPAGRRRYAGAPVAGGPPATRA